MSTLSQLIETLSAQGQRMGLDGFGTILVLYFILSWLVCVAGAFAKVKEVQFYVGLISMGVTLLVALVIGGLCRNFSPDLAASFTPGGLFLFSLVVGLLVCSVPLIQYFWDISYWHGLACVVGGICIMAAGLLVFQLLAHPVDQLPARLSVPLFQDHQPGFGN
jgi:hypothetical protein